MVQDEPPAARRSPADGASRITRTVRAVGDALQAIFGWNFGQTPATSIRQKFVAAFFGSALGVVSIYLTICALWALWFTYESLWPAFMYFLKEVFGVESILMFLAVIIIFVPTILAMLSGTLFGWLLSITAAEATAVTLFFQGLGLVILICWLFLIAIVGLGAVLLGLSRVTHLLRGYGWLS